MIRWLLVLPVLVFSGLVVAFYSGMMRPNRDDIPSTFINRAAPVLPETGLMGIPVLTASNLATGQLTVVNFWATWCPPCRAEHPKLLEMAASGIRVAGVNMMDDDAKALAYLAEEGNPFFAIATDPKGRNRVEWGVTAPPETFIIRGDGTVAYRFIGPLIGTDYEKRFLPALNAALAESAPSTAP